MSGGDMYRVERRCVNMRLPQQSGDRNNRKWWIVAASFLMVFTCLGFCSSTKGLYLAAITEALGIKRSLFSLNDSLRFITTAIINLFFGTLVNRFGTRKMVAAGFLSLITSMLIYSSAQSIYVFYIGGILLGLGLSWTTTTMVGYVVDCWVKEHKGTIMGAVLAANGLGGAVAAQILTPIIYDPASAFGYRNAYRLTALILLVVGVIVIAAFQDKPERDRPSAKKEKKAKGESWEGIEFSRAVRMPYFYMAAVCVFLTGVCLQSVSGVSSAHLRDVGFDENYIAIVVSVHSFALAAFKFSAGISYDKLGLKATMLICDLSAVVMIFLLATVQVGTAGSVIAMVFGILSSAALPLETIMLPLITSELFGKKSYAKLLGILVSINTAGYAIGVPVSNLCYDMLGSYRPVLLVLTGIMIGVTIVFRIVLRAAEKHRADMAGNTSHY